MRAADFRAESPGSLVTLLSGGTAYLPNPLPPVRTPSWALTNAIERARAAIAELSARLSQMLEIPIASRAMKPCKLN